MITSSSTSCDLLSVCQNCNADEDPYECCYWDNDRSTNCRLNRRPFHVNHSFLRSADWQAQLSDAQKEARRVLSSVRLAGAVSLHFPFIPEVKLGPKDRARSLSIIRTLDVPIVAVSIGEFYDGIRPRKRLSQARKQGLSEYLGFEGLILLTTDVPDKLCEHFLRYPLKLRQEIEGLDPTYVTTPDAPTYYNVPATISLLNIYRTIIALENLVGIKSHFVGLALGSNTFQLLWHGNTLMSLGCNILATPLYELRRSGHDDLARHRVDKLRGLGPKVLALSCSPSQGKKLIRADYYSSWSWTSFRKDDQVSETSRQKLTRFVNSSRREASQEILV